MPLPSKRARNPILQIWKPIEVSQKERRARRKGNPVKQLKKSLSMRSTSLFMSRKELRPSMNQSLKQLKLVKSHQKKYLLHPLLQLRKQMRMTRKQSSFLRIQPHQLPLMMSSTCWKRSP